MNYAIFRFQKAKTMTDVGVRVAHNLRSSEAAAPHADPARRGENEILVGPADAAELVAKVAERLASVGKFRKDAVRAVELVFTASPGFFDKGKSDSKQWPRWRDASTAWAKETFVDENVVSSVLHLDEGTPHIHVLFTPIHAGKLSASHWFDGPRKLRKLQDSYAEHVKRFGLRRGEEGSKSTHLSLSKFYEMATRATSAMSLAKQKNEPPGLPERGMFGRVSDDDWQSFSIQLDQYKTAFDRKLEEVAVLSEFVSSDVGKEALRRKLNAQESAARAQRISAEAMAEATRAEGRLQGSREDYRLLKLELLDLARQVSVKREMLGMGALEAIRDRLLDEVHELDRRAGRESLSPRD